jgi:UDP-glucose 4-epimerase
LLKENYEVVVFDNLSTGFIQAAEIIKDNYGEFEFIKGDLADIETLTEVSKSKNIDVVMHLSAKIDAAESVKNPELYHQENYLNSVNLIEAMTEAGISKFIFSSSAAVYGGPQNTPIDENHPTNPTSPYGQTKLDFEKYLTKVENLQYIVLRYFNVGGSDQEGFLGKSHLQSQDLIENIMKVALGQQETLKVFGDDYNTKDGTAIRDFVHVEDITQAHILALKKISECTGEIFNLGSETGFSIKEIVNKASIIIGQEIPTKNIEKREGDIEVSVASAEKAKKLLGWDLKYSSLDSIIFTDWNWRKKHLTGY